MRNIENYNRHNNVLVRMVIDYAQQRNLSQTGLAQLLGTHRGNIAKYLKNKIGVTKTILDRLGIKPPKIVLCAQIIWESHACKDISVLIDVYNKLNKENHR